MLKIETTKRVKVYNMSLLPQGCPATFDSALILSHLQTGGELRHYLVTLGLRSVSFFTPVYQPDIRFQVLVLQGKCTLLHAR